MKKLLFLLAALPLLAQQSNPTPACQQMNCYTASTGVVSLSAAGTAATIQQPATGPYQKMYGIKVQVYCSVACTVTRTYGAGATGAATTTAGTVVQSPFGPFGTISPLLNFFTASNASGGTTVDTTPIPAGGTFLWDISDVVFGTIPYQRYTFSVGSITGNAEITYFMGLK